MFLSDNLISTLNLIRDNNVEAYNLIVNYVSKCPYVRVEDHSKNHVSIETIGTFNGNVGSWKMYFTLDDTNKVDSIELNFIGSPSSRIPYTEQLDLKINGLHAPKNYFSTELVNMKLSRTNNYRYSSPCLKNLTSKDIKKMSSTEVVLNYTLKTKFDRATGKIIISSNEKFGNVAQSGNITTRELSEIEA